MSRSRSGAQLAVGSDISSVLVGSGFTCGSEYLLQLWALPFSSGVMIFAGGAADLPFLRSPETK